MHVKGGNRLVTVATGCSGEDAFVTRSLSSELITVEIVELENVNNTRLIYTNVKTYHSNMQNLKDDLCLIYCK